MRYALVLASLLTGACASAPSYEYANCQRDRLPDVNVLTCSDDSVGLHCKKLTGRSYHPRACHIPGKFGRKATIVVGRSYTSCTTHEFAHHYYPDKPQWVDSQYPCVGDAPKRSK